jgi:four helix bundle protein
MLPARSTHAAGPLPALLDAEKLQVYAVAVEFQTLAATLMPKGQPVLRDQLERASVSIVLNIAEGAGRRSRADKARFYGIARGSANECGAVIDLLRVRGLANETACSQARELLVRIVQMLTKLQQRMVR